MYCVSYFCDCVLSNVSSKPFLTLPYRPVVILFDIAGDDRAYHQKKEIVLFSILLIGCVWPSNDASSVWRFRVVYLQSVCGEQLTVRS